MRRRATGSAGATLSMLVAVTLQACAASPSATRAATNTNASARAVDYAREGRRAATHGDFVRAEHYLASAIRLVPRDARILHALVRVCVAASRLRAAHGHVEAYLLREPDAWQLRHLLAVLDIALGRRDDAERELSRVLEDSPNHADAYYLLAKLRDEALVEHNAQPLYAKYLELAPQGAHAGEARRALRAAAAKDGAP